MCGEYEYRITLAKLWTQAVLYGIYVMLFAGSIYVLVWRQQNSRFLAVTILLFIFTTAITTTQLALMLLAPSLFTSSVFEGRALMPCSIPSPAYEHESPVNNAFVLAQDCLSTAKFIVADGLMISRCLTLWSSRKWVIALLSVLLASTTACNLASNVYGVKFLILAKNGSPALRDTAEAIAHNGDLLSEIGGWLSLVTNISTTFLIALRIWMMTRDIEKVLGKRAAKRYHAAIAMIVESGVLYSASLLADSIVLSFMIDSTICNIIMDQLMAIAPTLVIVRVGMGKGFETVQDSKHDAASLNTTPTSHRRDHEAPAVSGIHFRTVKEAGSVGSALESNVTSGNVSTVMKDEKNTDGMGDVV